MIIIHPLSGKAETKIKSRKEKLNIYTTRGETLYMNVNRPNTPTFNGVRYINIVADTASNNVVKAFEKNKEYDLFLRKLDDLTEWKIEKTNTIMPNNPWIAIWNNVKLTKEAIDRYLKLFF